MSTLQATIPTRRVRVNHAALQSNVGAYCVVTQAVLIRLQSSPYRELRSVTCGFLTGQLYLDGNVSTYYMKQMAQEAVRAVNGVEVIFNQVIVRQRN